jgi:Skp family chaperone for outer membrane proteins
MRAFTALAGGALAAVIGLAGGRVMASLQDGAAGAKAAPCVCTVNVGKVFAVRSKQLQEDLQAAMDAIKTTMGQREAELRKQAQDLEARLSAGTPEYETERKKIELRIAELQYDQKRDVENLRRKQVTGMAALYREVTVEAERIAAARGFAAVLSVDDEPIAVEERGQVMAANDLKLQMALRTVIWADPAVDITKDVIEALQK